MDQNMWANVTISRGPVHGREKNRVGLMVQVQAREEVEQMLSKLSAGRKSPVGMASENWQSLDSTQLEYYDVSVQSEGNHYGFNTNGIGAGLFLQSDRNDGLRGLQLVEIPNLSFFQLVGISKPEGVTVGITGAYSLDYLKRAKSAFPSALKQFLTDYVIPVTINLHVISRSVVG